MTFDWGQHKWYIILGILAIVASVALFFLLRKKPGSAITVSPQTGAESVSSSVID
jgi:LPXTG-motif cell wall-anchored protein